MRIETYTDEGAVAERTAEVIADAARTGARRHGRAVLAFSGGSTPAPMLRDLGRRDLRWNATHIVQVDERVAPDGHDDRNWTMITEHLLAGADIPDALLHPMPVTADDLDAAAQDYASTLQIVSGVPPIADVIHLGLGADGHTASLVPGDPVLDVRNRWVAPAGPYQGRMRMTMTYPTINAARLLVWQVTGVEKAAALRQGLQGKGVPASRIRRRDVVVIATREAAAELSEPT
ncbi:MAG: 6-phosphogluconolactonase [Actinobacteria bacterium]|nr:6-phosphogluconolactonase [Actinomycetota bacterium]